MALNFLELTASKAFVENFSSSFSGFMVSKALDDYL